MPQDRPPLHRNVKLLGWASCLNDIAIGKGVRTSPRDAMIADSTVPEMRGRAFGFHRGMDHLGAAIGPVLAAAFLWLWPNQLRTLFLLTLIPGLIVVVILCFGLQERRPEGEAEKQFRFSLRPFGRDFRNFLLALIIFTLGNSSDAFLLVRAGELGVATPLLPLLWFAFHVVKSIGNIMFGRLVDKVGARLPLGVGWLMYAAIYVAFALATSVLASRPGHLNQPDRSEFASSVRCGGWTNRRELMSMLIR